MVDIVVGKMVEWESLIGMDSSDLVGVSNVLMRMAKSG